MDYEMITPPDSPASPLDLRVLNEDKQVREDVEMRDEEFPNELIQLIEEFSIPNNWKDQKIVALHAEILQLKEELFQKNQLLNQVCDLIFKEK
jgi:hypothetical protein